MNQDRPMYITASMGFEWKIEAHNSVTLVERSSAAKQSIVYSHNKTAQCDNTQNYGGHNRVCTFFDQHQLFICFLL